MLVAHRIEGTILQQRERAPWPIGVNPAEATAIGIPKGNLSVLDDETRSRGGRSWRPNSPRLPQIDGLVAAPHPLRVQVAHRTGTGDRKHDRRRRPGGGLAGPQVAYTTSSASRQRATATVSPPDRGRVGKRLRSPGEASRHARSTR